MRGKGGDAAIVVTVGGDNVVTADDLLDEAEKDRDDDGGFEAFAEDDEENWDTEEVASHDDRGTEKLTAVGSLRRENLRYKLFGDPF